MSLLEDKDFRMQLESANNIYLSIQNIVHDARNILKDSDYKMLHSEALTCAIHGIKPDKSKYINVDDAYECNYIKNMFCNIEDKEVCDAVYDSYYDSKSAKHLIYVYNNINDEPRRSRVRILTNMLWYELYSQ